MTTRESHMYTVTSRDGTRIAFWRSGGRPPLLLAHGGSADHTTTWRFVLPEIEQRFTVYAMDRRGRGGSGDAPAYELQREAEDVAAVVDSIGAPVNLLGHSFGGLCAIEAALLTPNLHRLILYEGVPLRGAEAGERTSSVIEILVLQALAHQTHGDIPAALVPLSRALTLAEPEGYVRLFVDEGPPMAALLEAAAKHGIAPSYVRHLLTALGTAADRPPVNQVVIEPLRP